MRHSTLLGQTIAALTDEMQRLVRHAKSSDPGVIRIDVRSPGNRVVKINRGADHSGSAAVAVQRAPVRQMQSRS